jgi:hypothetical protein
MTFYQLTDRLARAIAEYEGFYKPGSLAQRNANPGNVRDWRVGSTPYPKRQGYVDFVRWAATRNAGAPLTDIYRRAEAEGWRVLKVLVSQYLLGKYHGETPTLRQFFAKYAPAKDGNEPEAYAKFVARKLGLSDLDLDVALTALVRPGEDLPGVYHAKAETEGEAS